ncbi:hypothetical protein [Aeromonas sanarellii]|uniref:hypothetical protein n=1 Tax=Aeromonas sanarellii TaxID=633415 RepID=UPI003989B933
MKHVFTLLFSLLFIIACDDISATTSTGEHASSSSSTSSSSEREITLSGASGHTFIGEDELVLKDEMVFSMENHLRKLLLAQPSGMLSKMMLNYFM